ncbi:UDP-3-O-(3-hydroxymyristoyl) glucosamine N-acyltransferase [Geitlerinema sp. PCC 7407]|nr:UDP-3-O-(3-hydroxymyristoyl) glucosamine N-acyltransferase [Geitlerinema sp. PCC 7407]
MSHESFASVMRFSELVQALEATDRSSLAIAPKLNPDIVGVAAVREASAGTLSYIEGDQFASAVATTQASALILPRNPTLQEQAIAREVAWISAPDPRLVFAKAITLFYRPFRPEPGIHPSAVIHPSAKLGDNLYIGPHAVIQADVELGSDVCVHPNVVVYPGAKVGDRTVLHANCVIHERAQVGADCVIHSGAVVGSEGFGFVPTPQGWFKMDQSGIVVLEDGVEVGCNSTIDRPAVGETRIGQDTKLDNLVHVGHGVRIGRSCALAAQVGLAGGVTVGDRVLLAGQVGVANQAKIGNGVIATAKTGIHGEVPDGQVISGGTPPLPNKLWLRTSAVYGRLAEIYQTVRRLEKALGDRPKHD